MVNSKNPGMITEERRPIDVQQAVARGTLRIQVTVYISYPEAACAFKT
jgi:hypothetical protein